MTVTVSDINGIKQYNVPANIKKILYTFLLLFIVLIGGLFFYVKILNDKVVVLEKLKQTLVVQSSQEAHFKKKFEEKKVELENILKEKVAYEKELQDKIVTILSEKKRITKKIKLDSKKQLAKALLQNEQKLKKAEERLTKLALEKARKKIAEQKRIERKHAREEAERKKLAQEKHKKELEAKKIAKEKQAKEKAKKEKLAEKKRVEKKLAKERQEKLAKEKAKKEKLVKAKVKKESQKRVSKKEKNLPSIAKKKLGKRYVWGAVGPSVFDCSGFTSYVYKKTGINIPRTSRAQSKYGKYVKRDQLKPGDLIFFDTSRRSKGIINHVGIYIGGNKFIHASSAKKRVVITSLNKAFYSKRYKWARRIN